MVAVTQVFGTWDHHQTPRCRLSPEMNAHHIADVIDDRSPGVATLLAGGCWFGDMLWLLTQERYPLSGTSWILRDWQSHVRRYWWRRLLPTFLGGVKF